MSSKQRSLQMLNDGIQRLRYAFDQFNQSSSGQMSNRKRSRGDENQYQQSHKRQRPVQRRTHLMDHLRPRERQLVHEYYHEIGQKGGRTHGGGGYIEPENESVQSDDDDDGLGYDPRVKRGYLESDTEEKKSAVHKFLHAVQTKKNYGEKQAESELDEMNEDEGDESDDDEESDEEESPEPPPKRSRLSGGGRGSTKTDGRKKQQQHPLARLLKHMAPSEQTAVLRYFANISQLTSHQPQQQGLSDQVTGFLSAQPVEEIVALRKFLLGAIVRRTHGEKEALAQLDNEPESEAIQTLTKAKSKAAAVSDQPTSTASSKAPTSNKQQQLVQEEQQQSASQKPAESSEQEPPVSATKKPAPKKGQQQAPQKQQTPGQSVPGEKQPAEVGTGQHQAAEAAKK